MAYASKIKRQRGFLQIAFAIVLAISFVLILYENTQINKQQKTAASSGTAGITSKVRGQSVHRSASMSDYGNIVRNTLDIFNKNIDLLLQGKSIPYNEVEDAYNDLLAAEVPRIFQDLHFRVAQLGFLITRSGAIDEIIQKQGQIFAQYPFLKDTLPQ